jgi:S1-C subfamily serine protease
MKLKTRYALLSSAIIILIGSLLLLDRKSEFYTGDDIEPNVSSASTHCPVSSSSQLELSKKQLHKCARHITVKVMEGKGWGSGILIKREEDSYTVLTNAHVIQSQSHNPQYKIQTPDGEIHLATINPNLNLPHQEDLALLQFQSSKEDYQIAILGDSSQLQPQDSIIASGFPFNPKDNTDENGFKLTQGKVWRLLRRSLRRGYQLGYTGKIQKGMSGGPVLNFRGEVVGINGEHAYPLWDRPYIYRNGEEPPLALQEKMDHYNWAIPMNTVTQLLPQSLVLSPD